MFLVFDGARAVENAKRGTRRATAAAKAAGIPFSPITLRGQNARTKADRAAQTESRAAAAKPQRTRKARSTQTPASPARATQVPANPDKRKADIAKELTRRAEAKKGTALYRRLFG